MNLKRTIINTCIAASAMLYTSCELDLVPLDYYGSGSYWKTVPQVESYMNGIHVDLRASNFNRQFLLGEARGGTSKSGTSSLITSINYDRIKENNLDADNTGISGWNNIYGYIFDCNLLIQEVEGTALQSENASTINYLLAQAYGIRALHYFTLYRTYGGVPLIERVKVLDGQVDVETLYTPRASAKTIMDFIKSDLAKSLEYFGTDETIKGNKSYWSKATTTMLAADVYLWSAKVALDDQTPASDDLSKAKGYLSTILNDSRFGLCDNFSEIWDVNNKGNKEMIMVARFADGEATN